MAFDHGPMVAHAHARLVAKLSYTNIGFALAPTEFTLSTLRDIYGAALGLPGRRDQPAAGAGPPRGDHPRPAPPRRSGRSGGRPAALYRFTDSRTAGHRRVRRTASAGVIGHMSGRPFRIGCARTPHHLRRGAVATIGNSELDISPLALGGNTLCWTADEATSFAILDAFMAAGGNFVDSADSYSAFAPGNSGGESETVLGNWKASRGIGDEMLVATRWAIIPSSRDCPRRT